MHGARVTPSHRSPVHLRVLSPPCRPNCPADTQTCIHLLCAPAHPAMSPISPSTAAPAWAGSQLHGAGVPTGQPTEQMVFGEEATETLVMAASFPRTPS